MNRPNFHDRVGEWVPCIKHPDNVIHAFPRGGYAILNHFRSVCGEIDISPEDDSYKYLAKWHRAEDCESNKHTANFTTCEECSYVFIMQELSS